MTSLSQSKYWTQPSAYRRNIQWNQTISREQSFVMIRKSRKGTQLNIPETFSKAQMEQTFIEQIPILPAGGCCDMEYVMYRRENTLKRQTSRQRTQHFNSGGLRCSPSVTINIGTSQPVNGACQQNISYSTISINPTVVSEEPFQKKEVIPLGLYCCGKPQCVHVQSQEQRVLGLTDPATPSRPIDEKGFVYVTKPPTISPLKECWKLFTCKKKQKKVTDTYMPSVMTRTEPKECRVCPKTEVRESVLFGISKDQAYAVRSKLSTITESEVTVSEYSSEEFVSQDNKEKKERKKFQYPQKSYTGTGRILENTSMNSAKYSSTMYQSPHVHQQEGVYRWVCTPREKKGMFNFGNNKQYLCYKE